MVVRRVNLHMKCSPLGSGASPVELVGGGEAMSATMRTTLQTVPESLAADHVTTGDTVPPQTAAPQKARTPNITKVRTCSPSLVF